MTRKTARHGEPTHAVPFAIFALDFQLAMIQKRITETVAANDDLATVELRKRWARAQGSLSAARTALVHVSDAELARAYPAKATKPS